MCGTKFPNKQFCLSRNIYGSRITCSVIVRTGAGCVVLLLLRLLFVFLLFFFVFFLLVLFLRLLCYGAVAAIRSFGSVLGLADEVVGCEVFTLLNLLGLALIVFNFNSRLGVVLKLNACILGLEVDGRALSSCFEGQINVCISVNANRNFSLNRRSDSFLLNRNLKTLFRSSADADISSRSDVNTSHFTVLCQVNLNFGLNGNLLDTTVVNDLDGTRLGSDRQLLNRRILHGGECQFLIVNGDLVARSVLLNGLSFVDSDAGNLCLTLDGGIGRVNNDLNTVRAVLRTECEGTCLGSLDLDLNL